LEDLREVLSGARNLLIIPKPAEIAQIPLKGVVALRLFLVHVFFTVTAPHLKRPLVQHKQEMPLANRHSVNHTHHRIKIVAANYFYDLFFDVRKTC
jgi:hypothetical protein